jgi:hypothetical protein
MFKFAILSQAFFEILTTKSKQISCFKKFRMVTTQKIISGQHVVRKNAIVASAQIIKGVQGHLKTYELSILFKVHN